MTHLRNLPLKLASLLIVDFLLLRNKVAWDEHGANFTGVSLNNA